MKMAGPRRTLWLVVLFSLFASHVVRSQNLAAALGDFDSNRLDLKRPLEPAELEKFADAFFASGLSQWHVPGAVLVVVKDGRVVLGKGFGYANLETRERVQPDRTLFRVGSISKLFTATAIMQLYERGQLRLTDDVQHYLTSVEIDNPFPVPVTVEHLLTHTAGFDNHNIARHSRTPAGILPLSEYLRQHLPPVVYPPGEVINYSNFGLSLAGLVIEEVSGMPYEQYLRTNILEPLGMTDARFVNEVVSNERLAQGYRSTRQGFVALDWEYLNLLPSGGLVCTANDLARFMIAHLQNGRFQGRRILKEETAREMHRRQAGFHPELPGWCYGFYEDYTAGVRAIAHSGQPRGFYSLLYLLEKENLGVLVACNAQATGLVEGFMRRFLMRYVREAGSQVTSSPGLQRDLRPFTGWYEPFSVPQTTVARAHFLFQPHPETHVLMGKGGRLAIQRGDRVRSLVQAGPQWFRGVRHDVRVAFRTDENGEVAQMLISDEKPTALRKMAWWQRPRLHFSLMTLFVLWFLISLPLLVYGARRAVALDRLLLSLAGAVCFLNLMVLFGFRMGYRFADLRFGVTPLLKVLLSMGTASAVLSLVLPALTAIRWWRAPGLRLQRLHFFFTSLTFLAFTAFLNYWNLVGFRY